MRKPLTCTLLLLLAILFAPSASTAQPQEWLIIGDSWGVFLEPVQRAKINQLGWPMEVTSLAVNGSTAQQWANDANGWLTTAKEFLAALPAEEPAVVYISLGGNDLLDDYPSAGNDIFIRVALDVRTVAKELLITKPNTYILLGSYDILNFDRSLVCQILSLAIFGSTSPQDVNPVFLIGGDAVRWLEEQHPRVIALDVIGALQGSPGAPDVNQWSPAGMITPDCIHLTTAGYEIFNDAMFDKLISILGLDTSQPQLLLLDR